MAARNAARTRCGVAGISSMTTSNGASASLMALMIADGQVHGGVAQGIGNALYEEIVYDEAGAPLTATLADYMTPTTHEVPTIELLHMETPSTESITKAKGLGEGGGIGAPAAVINAINDALSPFDVVIDEMPATPQRVRAALRAATYSAHSRESGNPAGQ